jgi:hypothetical protein
VEGATLKWFQFRELKASMIQLNSQLSWVQPWRFPENSGLDVSDKTRLLEGLSTPG